MFNLYPFVKKFSNIYFQLFIICLKKICKFTQKVFIFKNKTKYNYLFKTIKIITDIVITKRIITIAIPDIY